MGRNEQIHHTEYLERITFQAAYNSRADKTINGLNPGEGPRVLVCMDSRLNTQSSQFRDRFEGRDVNIYRTAGLGILQKENTLNALQKVGITVVFSHEDCVEVEKYKNEEQPQLKLTDTDDVADRWATNVLAKVTNATYGGRLTLDEKDPKFTMYVDFTEKGFDPRRIPELPHGSVTSAQLFGNKSALFDATYALELAVERQQETITREHPFNLVSILDRNNRTAITDSVYVEEHVLKHPKGTLVKAQFMLVP